MGICKPLLLGWLMTIPYYMDKNGSLDPSTKITIFLHVPLLYGWFDVIYLMFKSKFYVAILEVRQLLKQPSKTGDHENRADTPTILSCSAHGQ